MHDTDDGVEDSSVLLAFPGVRGATPTADLLPTRSLPAPLLDPDCRDVAAHLVRLVRATYMDWSERRRGSIPRRTARPAESPAARWDGGYDRRGRYQVPVRVKLAWAAFGRGFDVADCVREPFSWHREVMPSSPNMLPFPAALEHYAGVRMIEVVRRLRDEREEMLGELGRELLSERMPFGTSRLQAAILKILRDPNRDLEPFFEYWLAARLDRGTPALREILATHRRPALLRYASAVRAHEAAYDHPLLSGFRATVAQIGRAFAELVAGDQSHWVPARPGRLALAPPAPGAGLGAGCRPDTDAPAAPPSELPADPTCSPRGGGGSPRPRRSRARQTPLEARTRRGKAADGRQ